MTHTTRSEIGQRRDRLIRGGIVTSDVDVLSRHQVLGSSKGLDQGFCVSE